MKKQALTPPRVSQDFVMSYTGSSGGITISTPVTVCYTSSLLMTVHYFVCLANAYSSFSLSVASSM